MYFYIFKYAFYIGEYVFKYRVTQKHIYSVLNGKKWYGSTKNHFHFSLNLEMPYMILKAYLSS